MKRNDISVSFDNVRDAVARVLVLMPEGAKTPHFVASYLHADYAIDYGTPASGSWNAAFGRFLKKHAAELGIREVKSKQPFTAVDGGRTTCSAWAGTAGTRPGRE